MTASESYFKSIEAQLVQEKFAPIATAKKLNAGKNNQTFLLEIPNSVETKCQILKFSYMYIYMF